jgi:hypothetical protein
VHADVAVGVLQVSGALNPDAGDGKAFQEAVIVRHPRHGEYAIAFVTGRTVLQVGVSSSSVHHTQGPWTHDARVHGAFIIIITAISWHSSAVHCRSNKRQVYSSANTADSLFWCSTRPSMVNTATMDGTVASAR